MNTKTKKTAEEMREYKLAWYHANKELSGEHKNQNTDKTHCVRGHELVGDNLVIKNTKSGEVHRICRACRNADAMRHADRKRREYDRLDPKRKALVRLRRRKSQLKKIGWTLENYSSTLEEQENKCAICKRNLELVVIRQGASIGAHADHRHSVPPKPRGILCGNCNLGIGNLQENIEVMKAAIAYLTKYQ